MDKDWIKAVTLLCVIAENNADSMRRTVRYIEIMKREYGLDGESFRQVYDEWFRTGEVSEKYRQRDWSSKRRTGLPLYHRGVDGMCRMLEEGVIEEDMFFEIFWETPYEVLQEEGETYTGFYRALPGCIGESGTKEKLKKEMQKALKKWIWSAVYMWRENKILEE